LLEEVIPKRKGILVYLYYWHIGSRLGLYLGYEAICDRVSGGKPNGALKAALSIWDIVIV